MKVENKTTFLVVVLAIVTFLLVVVVASYLNHIGQVNAYRVLLNQAQNESIAIQNQCGEQLKEMIIANRKRIDENRELITTMEHEVHKAP